MRSPQCLPPSRELAISHKVSSDTTLEMESCDLSFGSFLSVSPCCSVSLRGTRCSALGRTIGVPPSVGTQVKIQQRAAVHEFLPFYLSPLFTHLSLTGNPAFAILYRGAGM